MAGSLYYFFYLFYLIKSKKRKRRKIPNARFQPFPLLCREKKHHCEITTHHIQYMQERREPDVMQEEQQTLDLNIEDLAANENTENRVTKTRGFALAEYSKEMTLMQSRMYTEALSQIQKEDDPEVNQDYYVDIKKIASILGQDPRNMRKVANQAAKTLISSTPTVYFESEAGWETCSLFESIGSVPNAWNLYKIRFSDKMRRILIKMRKRFEIIYPSDTIIHFKNKYSHTLYDFLLAQMARMTPTGAYFKVKVQPSQLMKKLKYSSKGQIGAFNRDVIFPASKDIDEFSEVAIKGGAPELERYGRTVANYIFYVRYKPDREIPLVPYDDLEESQRLYLLSDVPTDDFLKETMQQMGVAESFVKYVLRQDQPMRCWRNLLYTKIHYGNQPRLFNQAYVQDYARKYDIQELLEQARRADPEFKDPITLVIADKKNRQAIMRKTEVKPQLPEYEQESLFGGEKTHELSEFGEELQKRVERIKDLKKMAKAEEN